MFGLRVDALTREVRVGERAVTLVRDVSFLVVPGGGLALTGPRDCGAGDVLRLIAGLDPGSDGTVALVGRPDAGPPPAHASPAFRQQVVHVSALLPYAAMPPARVLNEWCGLAATKRRRPPALTLPRRRPIPVPAALTASAVVAASPSATVQDQLAHLVGLACLLAPSHLLLDIPGPPVPRAARAALTTALLAARATGIGVIVVAQDEVLLASVADTVLVMLDGAIMGEGTPQSVITAAARQAAAEGAP